MNVVLVAPAVSGPVLVAPRRNLRRVAQRSRLFGSEDCRHRALGGTGRVPEASHGSERGKHAERERGGDGDAGRAVAPSGSRLVNARAQRVDEFLPRARPPSPESALERVSSAESPHAGPPWTDRWCRSKYRLEDRFL